MHSILVIAAHPDDEVLGCGGTITKLTDEGKFVHVAFFADGVSSRDNKEALKKIDLVKRRDAALRACNVLGVKSVSFDDLPDNRMDTIPLLDVIKMIETLLIKYKPDTILTHHAGDLNVDHQQLYQAVATACRPQINQTVKTILSFEVPSSTEWQLPGYIPVFAPNFFVDISSTLDRKLIALQEYSSEMRAWPHSRSIKAIQHLAHWRGATVGVDAAEAFVLGRHII